jgi:sugar/nucleoside kinase (ribokinase family)
MICVLGDAHLDVVVRLLGSLTEQALAGDTDTPAATSVGVGGQAANVAAWVAALGERSRLIAVRGTDAGADLVSAELARRGVELAGPVVSGRTGVVVSLSNAGTGRSMLTDRGVGAELTAAEIRPDWLAGCDWLHVSGYAFAREPVRAAALAAVSAARARDARVSVDLASTAMIQEYGVAAFGALIALVRPDVVFGTDAEAGMIDGLIDGLPEASRLIVKLGAGGVRAGGQHFPALPTVAVDATGAGDAFAAGYLVGGVELGLAAAARAVAQMGAMP